MLLERLLDGHLTVDAQLGISSLPPQGGSRCQASGDRRLSLF
jgi:hypothetical protein